MVNLPESVTLSSIDGLDVVEIANDYAQASIALYGAQVLRFCPFSDGRERLWLSEKAILDGSKPIRGGMPVCWPWFSDRHGQPSARNLPSHGYLRDQMWQLTDATEEMQATALYFSPKTTHGDGFDGDATVILKVTVGKSLGVSLITRNHGSDPITITCALHTYFAVSNIAEARITGLEGEFEDKTRDFARFNTPAPYVIEGEVDRVHLTRPDTLVLQGPDNQTHIHSEGHDSIVVWNPGHHQSATMSDMTDDGYQTMLCIETAVTLGVTIAAGEEHTLTQRIE